MWIKNVQFDIKKCITWSKKSGKGKQQWNKACMDVGIQPRNLNTLVKTSVAGQWVTVHKSCYAA